MQIVDGVSEHLSDRAHAHLLDRAAAPKDPLTVLNYATRHGYTEIMDVAAKETIGIATDEVAAILPPTYLLVWVSAEF